MISDSYQCKFRDTDYLQKALSGTKIGALTEKIYRDHKVKFSQSCVSYKEFQHTKPRSLIERVIECPFEALASAIRIAYVALAALGLLLCGLLTLGHTVWYFKNKSPRPSFLESLSRDAILQYSWQKCQCHAFIAVRGCESLTGAIVGLAHDKLGAYLSQEAKFQENCYMAFNVYKSSFLSQLETTYNKTSLYSFLNEKSAQERDVIHAELKNNPNFLRNSSLQEELENPFVDGEMYEKAKNLDAALQKLIPITKFTKKSELLKYALMEESELNKLTLAQVTSVEAAPVISYRLRSAETTTSLPKNVTDLTLPQIRGLTKEQIETVLKKQKKTTSRLISSLLSESQVKDLQ